MELCDVYSFCIGQRVSLRHKSGEHFLLILGLHFVGLAAKHNHQELMILNLSLGDESQNSTFACAFPPYLVEKLRIGQVHLALVNWELLGQLCKTSGSLITVLDYIPDVRGIAVCQQSYIRVFSLL